MDHGELHPDQRVDQYRIRHQIGQGGMGAVYLARDTTLGRRVALKVVLPERAGAAGVEAFLEEARVTARFSHPNIVTVYGVGEVDGRPYLALEYVDGRTLRQRMQAGRVPMRQALRIGLEIASALAEAHRQDVLHRDLKPENVLLANDGRVRVVDFGLARQVAPGEDGPPLAGTPAYLAPEQWLRAATSPASDVWALGITLYEMLSGAHPFLGDDLASRPIHSVRGLVGRPGLAPPPLPADEYPAEVIELVSRCLDPDPAGRPAAAAIAAHLDGALRGRDPAGDADNCPFRGLLAFSESEAGVFFGREAEVALFVERLRTEPTLAVVGPSGAGKSSFAFAGVVPRLREREPVVLLSMRPGRDPIGALASRLAQTETGATRPRVAVVQDTVDFDDLDPDDAATPGPVDEARPPPSDLGRMLRRTPTVLAELLGRLAAARRARVLLVVDQLEEVETLCADPVDRAAFLTAVCTAADDAAEPVRVVLTVRDDFLGRLADNPAAARALAHVAVMRPMDRDALREALVRPLDATGHRFDDPRVVERMLDEVAGEHTPLPILQFAARALWERRDADARELRLRDYEALGGVGGALARHADDVLAALDGGQRELARRLLLGLVTADGTRRVLPWDEVVGGLPDGASEVLERLVQARLLALREGEAREVELAHESLIETWGRLRRWTAEARDEVRALEEIEEAARLWERRGRRADDVWTDASLDTLQSIASGTGLAASGRAREFVEAGVALRRRRAARTRRLVVLGFGVLAAIAAGSIAAAWSFAAQREVAVASAEAAITARAEALVSGGRAALASGDPLEARAKLRAALELRDSSAARGLWWDLRGVDTVWSLQGGVPTYAVAIAPDGVHGAVAGAEGIVRVYDLRTARAQTLLTDPEDLGQVAFSPDGRSVAAMDYEGGLRVWSLDDGRARALDGLGEPMDPFGLWWPKPDAVLATLTTFDDRTARIVRWSVSGGAPVVRQVGLGGPSALDEDGRTWVKQPVDGGPLEVWDLDDADAEPRRLDIGLPRVRVWKLTLEPGGSGVVLLGHQVRIVDRDTGALRVEFPNPVGRPLGAWWIAPDALAIADRHGAIAVVDPATGAVRHEHAGRPMYVQDGAWSPEGWLLYSELYGARVVDVRHGSARALDRGHRGQIEGLDVAADGLVASGAADGRVLRWTADGRPTELTEIAGHPISAVRFSDDGARLGVAASGGEARVVRVEDGQQLATLPHADDVMGLDFTPDGAALWTADWSGVLSEWDLTGLDAGDGRPPVLRGQIGSDANLRGVSAFEGGIAVVDALGRLGLGRRGERRIQAHDGDTHTVVDGGGRIATGSFDASVRVWTTAGVPVYRREMFGSARMALSRDGRTLGVVVDDGVVVVDVDTGDERPTWATAPVNALALQPGAPALYGADRFGTIRSWDTESGVPRWRGVALSTDPPAFHTHRGWEVADGALPDGLPDVGGAIQWDAAGDATCALGPDRSVVARVGAQSATHPTRRVVRVDALPGGCAVLDGDGLRRVGPVAAVAIDPAARWARVRGDRITTLGPERIAVWDATGTPVSGLRAPAEATAALAVGAAVYVGFREGSVERWIDGHRDPGFSLVAQSQAPVADLLPGPPGTLFVALADGEIALWDTASGARVLAVKLHGPPVRWALAGGDLLVLTEVGDFARLDLSVFAADRCALVTEVAAEVPVTWTGDSLGLAGPAPACAPR